MIADGTLCYHLLCNSEVQAVKQHFHAVSRETIRIESKPPRHELENPVLIAWTTAPVAPTEWVIDLSSTGVAHVICKRTYNESQEVNAPTEVIPVTEAIAPALILALLEYDGEYGPIREIENPVRLPPVTE